jgi:hypothetical protein
LTIIDRPPPGFGPTRAKALPGASDDVPVPPGGHVDHLMCPGRRIERSGPSAVSFPRPPGQTGRADEGDRDVRRYRAELDTRTAQF